MASKKPLERKKGETVLNFLKRNKLVPPSTQTGLQVTTRKNNPSQETLNRIARATRIKNKTSILTSKDLKRAKKLVKKLTNFK